MSKLNGSAFPTTDNFRDVFFGGAKFGGKFALKNTTRSVTGANFINLSIRQRGIWMAIAMSVATLFVHILHIVGMRAKKQVGRVDASGIVAFMTDQLIVGQFAMREFVSNAVRLTALIATQLDLPVALAVKRALPLPTFVGAALANLLPKAFSQWAMRGGLVAADVLSLPAREFRSGDNLPTSAFAQDGARGMILHSNVSFVDLLTPPNDSTRCGGNSFAAFIIPLEAQRV